MAKIANLQEVAVTDLKLPSAGEKVETTPADAISVNVQTSGGAKNEFESLKAYWTEADKNTPLTANDKFVSGRTYRIYITIEFLDEAPLVKADDTVFTVNKQTAKYKENVGKSIVFYCDFY